MRGLRLLWAFALARGPAWLAAAAHAGKRVTIDGRRIDAKALAVGELANFLRPPGQLPTLAESRRSLQILAQKLDLPCPAGVQTRDITLPGAAGPLPARLYDTDLTATGRPALLLLHGGGWVQGGIDTHDGLAGQLALEAGVRVILPEYRLAPEHPFPAAPDDVLAIWRALTEDPAQWGLDPARIFVGGDSAGGNLTAALTHDLAAAGEPVPAGQVLIYPALDEGYATPSMESLRAAYVLPRNRMEWYVAQYLPPGEDPAQPRAAPARSGHLAASPPTFIVVAGHDPLRDDGIEHAARLKALGVPVELKEYPGQIHAFVSIRKAIPDGVAAVGDIARWLRARLVSGPPA